MVANGLWNNYTAFMPDMTIYYNTFTVPAEAHKFEWNKTRMVAQIMNI